MNFKRINFDGNLIQMTLLSVYKGEGFSPSPLYLTT